MKGLKKVSGETKSLRGCYDSIYLHLYYNKSKDEVFTVRYCDLGHSWQTYFDDENIISICNLCEPHTMKEIERLVLVRLLSEVMICQN